MSVALLFFWPNYALCFFYATFFKWCSSKTMANKSKNAFYLIRSRLFLLAIIIYIPGFLKTGLAKISTHSTTW